MFLQDQEIGKDPAASQTDWPRSSCAHAQDAAQKARSRSAAQEVREVYIYTYTNTTNRIDFFRLGHDDDRMSYY